MNITAFRLHTKLAKIQLRKALSIGAEIEIVDCDLLNEILLTVSMTEKLLQKTDAIVDSIATPSLYPTFELEAVA